MLSRRAFLALCGCTAYELAYHHDLAAALGRAAASSPAKALAMSQNSLLLAMLETTHDPHLQYEIASWVGQTPERQLLIMQALYEALIYALHDDPDVATIVGTVLADTIRQQSAGGIVLGEELVQQLKARFARYKTLLA